MTEFGEYIKKVRDSKGMTLNQVALYSEISAAQLSRIETGKRNAPKPATVKKIADALKIDYEVLMEKAGYIEDIKQKENNKNLPELTSKDEKDIAKKLENILNSMDSDTALSFDGEPMDDETKDLVRAAIESNLILTKQLAKKKFTPNKYRKNKE